MADSEKAVDLRLLLPDGEALTAQRATAITAAAPTRVVILAGAEDSGKTTLLTSLYEKFLQGRFADHLFAGSATLPAYEQRCHRARIQSGAVDPDTERTKGLDVRLLHLKLRHE